MHNAPHVGILLGQCHLSLVDKTVAQLPQPLSFYNFVPDNRSRQLQVTHLCCCGRRHADVCALVFFVTAICRSFLSVNPLFAV